MAEIKSVKSLLEMNLIIPEYQRPFKWTHKNVADLLTDIDYAISDAEKYQDYKYRIGSIILHTPAEDYEGKCYIVDGQQRIISLVLLRLFLDNSFTCNLLSTVFISQISQVNIHKNYHFIKDWFSLKSDDYKSKFINAFDQILEVVIISVTKEAEAFQLFDSQNTRGRALDPHDLLKAYHLREMKNYPYEMQHAVTKWEAVNSKDIKELFELYLFPIRQWIGRVKSHSFSANDIDIYKGITENSPYTYAKRASKAMPHFQIAEPFIAGNDFFEMVEHYLKLLSDLKNEIYASSKFSDIKNVLINKSNNSTGFKYSMNLFFCAIICFYDRFKCIDEKAFKKLFSWAFMIRVNMISLGFDSINKYAIGEGEDRYSNRIPIFSKITHARLHNEITNLQIEISGVPDSGMNGERSNLYAILKELNGCRTEEV